MNPVIIPVLPEDSWLDKHRAVLSLRCLLPRAAPWFPNILGKKKPQTTQKMALLAIDRWGGSCPAGTAEMSFTSRLWGHMQTPPVLGS